MCYHENKYHRGRFHNYLDGHHLTVKTICVINLTFMPSKEHNRAHCSKMTHLQQDQSVGIIAELSRLYHVIRSAPTWSCENPDSEATFEAMERLTSQTLPDELVRTVSQPAKYMPKSDHVRSCMNVGRMAFFRIFGSYGTDLAPSARSPLQIVCCGPKAQRKQVCHRRSSPSNVLMLPSGHARQSSAFLRFHSASRDERLPAAAWQIPQTDRVHRLRAHAFDVFTLSRFCAKTQPSRDDGIEHRN